MNQSSEARIGSTAESEALGIKAVAQSLGVSRATVLRWIRAKKLEGFFRIGHKWLIRKSDFESFINGRVAQQSRNDAV